MDPGSRRQKDRRIDDNFRVLQDKLGSSTVAMILPHMASRCLVSLLGRPAQALGALDHSDQSQCKPASSHSRGLVPAEDDQEDA